MDRETKIGLPIGEVYTMADSRDHTLLLAEIGDLYVKLQTLERKLIPLEWLARQSVVSTPGLFWVKAHGRSLEESIREAAAIEDMRQE